jgi:ABC-type nitrate/sulfonate/bicarbonate transport system substrate-binding protein
MYCAGGLPFVAVAGSNMFVAKTHQSRLVVAPNAPFKDAKDLNGKTLGVAGLKNITEVAFDLWMDTHGAARATFPASQLIAE